MSRFAAPVVAVGLWLLSVFLMVWIAIAALLGGLASVPLVGSLLAGADPTERVAPIATLALFGWVLVLLALRARRVWSEIRVSNQLAGVLSGVPQQSALTALGTRTRAGQRAQSIANGLRGLGDLHEILPNAASLEATALQTSYSGFHVYAWVLPVLGFIGTALAMSAAIQGFAGGLNETVKIETLVPRLAQTVIPGLAAAFGATVLALAAALVAYVATVALQTLEEEALETCDAASAEFLSRVGRPPSVGAGVDPTIATLLQKILTTIEKLSADTKRPGDLVERAASAITALDSAAQQLEGAAVRLGDSAAIMKQTAQAPYHITVTRGSGS